MPLRSFLLLLLVCLPMQAKAMSEDELKAAYVYNFVLFTDWPEKLSGAFNLCLIGKDSVTPYLESMSGKMVHGLELQTRRISPGESLETCRVVYIAASENLHSALARASRANALTVTDDPQGALNGAMIALQQQGNRIGFAINPASVRKAGITLSSKLLKLARIIE